MTTKQWTVPVHLELRQIVKFGKQRVQIFAGPTYTPVSPIEGVDWGFRFGFTLLFPK